MMEGIIGIGSEWVDDAGRIVGVTHLSAGADCRTYVHFRALGSGETAILRSDLFHKTHVAVRKEPPARIATSPRSVAALIAEECDSLREMLLEKNRAYGNSALEPLRIFSTANPTEQIRVRIDDKLSRLARGSAAGEDVILDLLGYMVLLRVAMRMESGQSGIDAEKEVAA